MYYENYGSCDNVYPAYGYGGGFDCGVGRGGCGFALIVVLFILLIIIGACWCFPN